VILLNNMIPISLYVTLELVKVLQCSLLYNQDRKMYHSESDTPFVCRTTTLNEELGLVGGGGGGGGKGGGGGDGPPVLALGGMQALRQALKACGPGAAPAGQGPQSWSPSRTSQLLDWGRSSAAA
jgi:hypothetical protein